MALSNLGKGAPREAHYVSNCKVCRRGIYRDQTWSWSTGRVLGLVHDACVEEP